MEPLQYEAICKYVGKLFLETNFQLENQGSAFQKTLSDLRQQLQKLEQERDDALRLLTVKREQNGNV